MKPKKQMSAGFQEWNIRRKLAAEGVDTEMGDISSDIDRSLSYRENKALIMKARGVAPKHATSSELQRERAYAHAHGGSSKGYRQARVTRSEKEGGWYQIGTTTYEIDRNVDAKWPGKRKSRSGKHYIERRKNRSDYPGSRT